MVLRINRLKIVIVKLIRNEVINLKSKVLDYFR